MHDIRFLTGRRWISEGLRKTDEGMPTPFLDVDLGVQRSLVADPAFHPHLINLHDDVPLPPGTLLSHFFESGERRLLVVGDVGSGKSTHLLQLAEVLLDEEASSHAPVVLLLSEWKTSQQFRDWLGEQMWDWYHLDPGTVENLLVGGKVALLLDGLDEIPQWTRKEKVVSINDFLMNSLYSSVAVVITSRERDYRDGQVRLRLRQGVRIRPFSRAYIADVFSSRGSAYVELRDAVLTDKFLEETLATPLMLTVSIVAFADGSEEARTISGNVETIRNRIFELFELKMLARDRTLIQLEEGSSPKKKPPFSPQQMHLYLVFLARMMKRKNALLLYVDELTPAWLPGLGDEKLLPPPHRSLFSRLAERIGLDHASTGTVGAIFGLIFGMLSLAPAAIYIWGPTIGLVTTSALSFILSASIFTMFGLTRMKLFPQSLAVLLNDQDHNARAATRWVWVATTAIKRSPASLLIALLTFVLALPERGPVASLVMAGTVVIGSALGAGMSPDFERLPNRPWEALRISSLVLSLLVLLTALVGLVVALIVFRSGGPWIAAIVGTPIAASLLAITGPGRAWLRISALRFGGSLAGLIPFRIIDFLDYADELNLMRRQGGGYAFFHAALHTYFESADPHRL